MPEEPVGLHIPEVREQRSLDSKQESKGHVYQLVCFGVWDKREEAEEGSILKLGLFLFLWSGASSQSSPSLSRYPFSVINSHSAWLLKVWQQAKVLFKC